MTRLVIVSALLVLLPLSAALVHDIDGHAVQSGRNYYIMPASAGGSGGLTGSQRNSSCPLYVAQDTFEAGLGIPVMFMPVDQNDTVIRLSTDMNIRFDGVSICMQGMVWRLVDGEHPYIVTDGAAMRPGQETASSWFRIERYESEDYYKLVYCPGVCKINRVACGMACGDIGVFLEGGTRWLGPSDVPLPLVFMAV